LASAEITDAVCVWTEMLFDNSANVGFMTSWEHVCCAVFLQLCCMCKCLYFYRYR